MVTYSYTVSKSGPTSSIQEVITHIKNELANFPTIERDIEILIGEGSYSGFTIPNGALLPLLNSPHRLIIKSGGSYFPVIDFNFSSELQTVGVDIGASNPNVVVEGLRIQFFAVGCRFSLGSHNPIIRNCLILNNRNVGLYIEQSNQAQISQNIVLNGDYGIVSRLNKDAIIIHNTVFQNGAISSEGESKSAIWAELENDYGGGISDTGRLHLIGNIAWNLNGNCITLFETDLENGAIVSNFNNFVNSNEDLIRLEDKRFYNGAGQLSRITYRTLTEWKRATGQDIDSISEDPKFIQPLKIRQNRNGYAIDLTILPLSPVLAKVPSFYDNTTAAATWLPSYYDTAQIRNDIINNQRQKSNTAIGANDKKSNSGFYGQDIFSNPLDLGLNKECGVDPLLDLIFKKLDVWYPKLRSGYFYSNERQYYLYSKKECLQFSDILISEFTLPRNIATNQPIIIKNKGKEIAKENYDAYGNTIIVYHKGLSTFSIDEEFDIECFISEWKDNGFYFSKTHYVFKIREGRQHYLLPHSYVPKGPVVVTDDKINFQDSDEVCNREYSVSFNKEFGRSEVEFKDHSNICTNGQFDYGFGDVPNFWEGINCLVTNPASVYKSAFGDYVCNISSNGYIGKTFAVSEDNHCFSFHLRGQGTIRYSIEYFDANFKPLGYVVTGEVQAVDTWKRKAVVIGQESNIEEPFIPTSTYPLLAIDYTKNIENLGAVTIKLTNIGDYDIEVDGVQFEKTNAPSLYHRRFFFNELTIEFETLDDDYYIIDDMAISPVRNLANSGFLQIPELTADLFDPNVKTPVITTLHEYRWQKGRKTIMPWARTRGKDKLRNRPKGLFHEVPQKSIEILAPVLTVGQPLELRMIPSLPIVSQQNRFGTGISFKCTADNGLPLAYGSVVINLTDNNLSFPGWLHTKKYGLKEQLGQVISGKFDNAGIFNFEYISPPVDDSIYFGKVPKAIYSDSGYKLSFIRTPYPVNLDNHGNIKLLKDDGTLIQTESDVPIQDTYTPAYTKNTSIVQVDFPIKHGSVKVIINNKQLQEINFNVPKSDEFYVDYEASKIYLIGRIEEVYVEYSPVYSFVNISDPYEIIFIHDKVFGDYVGNITVTYDYIINITAFIEKPGYTSFFIRSFDVVVQNNLLTKYITDNKNSILID